MADYKLSQLNSIDTIRSEDLLHIRVKKRPEMLGDEDRRMTYQDFLASFKLERFVQIAGSTMVGDLGIVKLLYGGKAVFDPTDSSEITIGDVLKSFKINSSGLKLTIADASRSATVYHTLNKPSPNELGMRTNEENDARYARLAGTNTFSGGTQNIQGDGNLLRLRNQNANNAQYIEGVNLDGSARWWIGIGSNGSDEVKLYNNKYNSALTVASNISVNKSLAITGQVQPSDFSNLDARYFTQTVANQRFAQLAANNTFRGINNFAGEFKITRDNSALIIKNASNATGLYLLGLKADGTTKFYLGTDTSDSVVNLHNYSTSTTISLSDVISATKTVRITGQVQPSDWANIDSRYIPAATLSTIARTNARNTFNGVQTVVTDNEGLIVKNSTQNRPLYIRGVDTANVSRWWIGVGGADTNDVALNNSYSGTQLVLGNTTAYINKTLTVAGQVKPSDWSNLDARYFVKTKLLDQSLMTVTVNNLEDHQAFNLGYSGFVRNNGVTDGLRDLAIHVAHSSKTAAHARGISFSYGSVGLGVFTYAYDGEGEYAGEAQLYTTDFKPTPSDIGAYTKAETDQKIAQAVSDSTDLNKIYPVGIVTWFNSNVNPNTALPGLTWTYLNNGVGRTIRIAAANGSDVATTGGSDSVTLSVGNLPSHTHSFSATTSSFDYGTKRTDGQGAHDHDRGNMEIHGDFGFFRSDASSFYTASGSFAISGSQASRGYTGNNFTYGTPVNFYASRTWTGRTSWVGAHTHGVGIGAHNHTVSGNTGGTGSGSAFSVTNQFYKLMAWVRTA